MNIEAANSKVPKEKRKSKKKQCQIPAKLDNQSELNEPDEKLSNKSEDVDLAKRVEPVVVSVKKYFENSEITELTNLFRKMIGIDGTDTSSTVVRQFSCSICYRAWWRRVRACKQVSSCIKCHKKYDPLPFYKEFGIGEFHCSCSNIFHEWSSNESTSQCKLCKKSCSPLKILSNSGFRSKARTRNEVNNSLSSRSSSSYSDNTHQLSGNNNRRYWRNNRKFFCTKCSDTQINLNSSLVFKPKNYSYENYNEKNSNKNQNLSFCKYCRKIPAFSNCHISTGSTIGSLSYQGDLDIRFIGEDIDLMETCIEHTSEDEQS